jgi:hypothetical protein
MKRLLSLFDRSGQWAAPFAENGWDVICWDIKLSKFMNINFIKSAERALDLFEDVDGILIAPPCTDFSVSGAQYWGKKDADGTTAAAVQLVRQAECLVDLFRPTDEEYYENGGTFFWVLENPVGRISKLTGIGDPIYFDPYQYAGYLDISEDQRMELDRIRLKNGVGVTQEEAQLVVDCNAYTKKTGLWGEFRMPEKKEIPPVKCAPQGSFTQRLGGKSDKTKELRSNTPMGFAKAFYEANYNYQIEY